jgi:hypothetical protein
MVSGAAIKIGAETEKNFLWTYGRAIKKKETIPL